MLFDLHWHCLSCDTRLARQTGPKLAGAESETPECGKQREAGRWVPVSSDRTQQCDSFCITKESLQSAFKCFVTNHHRLCVSHGPATNIGEMQIWHSYLCLCTTVLSLAPGQNTRHLITFTISSNSRAPDIEQISEGRGFRVADWNTLGLNSKQAAGEPNFPPC